MKIGFVVSFFDFRNDVRRVISLLAQQHSVVVYGKPGQKDLIMKHLPANVEFREIIEEVTSLKNKLFQYAFMLMKRIPLSKRNYYLMEWFKATNIKDPELQKKARKVISKQQLLPKIVSYDVLLSNLSYQGKTQIDDIDKFILFSEVADDHLLARLLNEKKNIKLYVYSWDHPFKHTRFSKKIEYLCWSEGIRQDLVAMQGIPFGNIQIAGASQFGYIDEFKTKLNDGAVDRTFPFEYIYFGCAIGINDLVEQELAIVKRSAEITLKVRPDLKFVVRPYPVLDKWALYDDLKKIPNVIVDDSFRSKDLSIKDEFIIEKFEKIHHAKAFLHLGTTMGLEACYTDTPSFIVDLGYTDKSILSLYSFIHQSQNEKYLINVSDVNTISDFKQYEGFLQETDHPKYLAFNKEVRKTFPIASFESFSEALIAER